LFDELRPLLVVPAEEFLERSRVFARAASKMPQFLAPQLCRRVSQPVPTFSLLALPFRFECQTASEAAAFPASMNGLAACLAGGDLLHGAAFKGAAVHCMPTPPRYIVGSLMR
jgi:hypothetical protein